MQFPTITLRMMEEPSYPLENEDNTYRVALSNNVVNPRVKYNTDFGGVPITGNQVTASTQSNTDLFVRQMLAGNHLRENMITVFGYLLNKPDNPLTRDLFSGLHLIQQALQTKRIHIFNLLSKLKSLAYEPPKEQFLIVFKEIHRTVPRYLVGTTLAWIEQLEYRRLSIDSWLRPNGGALVVDFLAGFDLSVLDDLTLPLTFNSTTNNSSVPIVKEQMGDKFARMFNAIKDGSTLFTPQLLAVFLLHLPGEIIPHKEETVIYLATQLCKSSVSLFSYDIKEKDLSDHITIVKAALQIIADTPDEIPDIRGAARYLLPYIKHPPNTSSSPYYDNLHPLVSKPAINIPLLLKSVQGPEYPIDIVDAGKRIIQYIHMRYLDMEDLSSSFDRYKYNNPIDILIGVLTKAQYKRPRLPEEVLATVRSLQMYMIFRKLHCNMISKLPENFINYQFMVDDLNSPIVPEKLRVYGRKIKTFLHKNGVDLNHLAEDMSLEECSRPRQCIMTLLTKALAEGEIKSLDVTDSILELRAGLGPDGNPLITYDSSFLNMKKSTGVDLQMKTRPNVSLYMPETDDDMETGEKRWISPHYDRYKFKTSSLRSEPIRVMNAENWKINKIQGKEVESSDSPNVAPEWKLTKNEASTSVDSIGNFIPFAGKKIIINSNETFDTNNLILRTVPSFLLPEGANIDDYDLQMSRVELEEEINYDNETTADQDSNLVTVKDREIHAVRMVENEEDEIIVLPESPSRGTEIYEGKKVGSGENMEGSEVSDGTKIVVSPLTTGIIQSEKSLAATQPLKPIAKAKNHTKSPLKEEKLPEVTMIVPQNPFYGVDLPDGTSIVSQQPSVEVKSSENTRIVVNQSLKDIISSEQKIVTNQQFENLKPLDVVNIVPTKSSQHTEKLDAKIEKTKENLSSIAPAKYLPLIDTTLIKNGEISAVINSDCAPENGVVFKPCTSSTNETSFSSKTPNVISTSIKPDVKKAVPQDFPPIDIVYSKLPPNLETLEQLIPPTEPLSPGDVKMRPIRLFLTQRGLLEQLGTTFDPIIYTTRLTLLVGILEESVKLHEVLENISLKTILSDYLDYLKQHISANAATVMQVIWSRTINALQPPTSPEETTKYSIIVEFLVKPDLHELLGSQFDSTKYKTNGELLIALFDYLLELKFKLDKILLDALMFYKNKIMVQGYGAQGVLYYSRNVTVIYHEKLVTTLIEKTIDLTSVFTAIDFKPENRFAVYRVEKFFSKEFSADKHMNGFDFMRFKTKGKWLKSFFRFLMNNKFVSDKLKDDINKLSKYILLTGPGAEEVEYVDDEE